MEFSSFNGEPENPLKPAHSPPKLTKFSIETILFTKIESLLKQLSLITYLDILDP